MAAFAAHIGLAAIIGAFLAGMIVAETKELAELADPETPLYAFFPPFFSPLPRSTRGARLGARGLPSADARVVALGMVPRGEVGIIVAGIGATAGVIDDQLFAVIVGMSILTTLLIPPLLRRALANQA